MHVAEITTGEELVALRPEWGALWERCGDAGPFQHPDWLLPWWRHLGGGRLWALAVREGADLLALAPFFVHAREDGTRQLTLLGNGVSDRLDILAAAAPAARALFAHLDRAPDWDTCDFRDLPPGSFLLDYAARHPAAVLDDDPACPVLALAGAAPDLAGIVPTKLLSNLRNRARRAHALGPMRIERADAGTWAAALDALLALHASRWSARGEAGVLEGAAIAAFLGDVAERFVRHGWLRLYVLRVGGDVAAANYGFHVRGRAYSYIGGFDPRFIKISPGALIFQGAISDAVREGASAFDFLRGAEAYKYEWGAADQPQRRVRILTRAPGVANGRCGAQALQS